MVKRLLVALASLALVPLVAPAPAPADADTARPPVKRVTRQYGDGPVRVGPHQVLRLRFEGRRGDRVTLNAIRAGTLGTDFVTGAPTGSLRLLDAAGRWTGVEPDASGFVRLPATGWFKLRFAEPWGESWRLVLTLQRRRTYQPGQVLRVPQRWGYQYLVRMRVATSRQLWSFGIRPWWVVERGRPYSLWHSGDDEPLLVAPGFPIATGNRALPLSLAPRAGEVLQVLLDPNHPAVVQARAVPTASLTLDGPAVAVPIDYRSTIALTFAGRAGDMVELHWDGTTDREARPIVLFGPGRRVVLAGRFEDVRYLPFTGTYTAVPMSFFQDDQEYSVRLASLEDLGEVQVDGPPLVVDARPDGRLVTARLVSTSAQATYAQVVEDTLSSADWSAFAGILYLNCPPWGPLGCGDYSAVGLSRSTPSSGLFYGGVVIVDTAASASGSLSISFTSTPPAAAPAARPGRVRPRRADGS